MNAPLKKKRMTVDEFIPWAMSQPGGRWELIDGEPVMMSPERAGHWRTKAAVHRALASAVQRAGLGCEAVPDGATVRINQHRSYEPDALVYCGPELPPESVEVPNPVIIVEVLSPGTENLDTGAKFRGYFSLPSVSHYLIIDPQDRTVVHHARGADGRIVSVAITDGSLTLDPPGIEVPVAEFFR